MFIFLAIVMGPGCGFMLYALRQFWVEARRFQHADPRRLPVTIVAAIGPSGEYAPYPGWETPEAEALPEEEPVPAEFAVADDRRGHAKVVATYLENRLAAIPSGTGRLAVKRVAKGSF